VDSSVSLGHYTRVLIALRVRLASSRHFITRCFFVVEVLTVVWVSVLGGWIGGLHVNSMESVNCAWDFHGVSVIGSEFQLSSEAVRIAMLCTPQRPMVTARAMPRS